MLLAQYTINTFPLLTESLLLLLSLSLHFFSRVHSLSLFLRWHSDHKNASSLFIQFHFLPLSSSSCIYRLQLCSFAVIRYPHLLMAFSTFLPSIPSNQKFPRCRNYLPVLPYFFLVLEHHLKNQHRLQYFPTFIYLFVCIFFIMNAIILFRCNNIVFCIDEFPWNLYDLIFFFQFVVIFILNFFFFCSSQQGVVLTHNASARVIRSNQSLVLQRVTRHSAGNYSCSAINAEGETVSNQLELRVKCEYMLFSTWILTILLSIHSKSVILIKITLFFDVCLK